MRRLLRWLFGLETVDNHLAHTLGQRLDDLEDHLAHLARRFDRLRGQVTGALRRYDEEELEDEEEDLLDDVG